MFLVSLQDFFIVTDFFFLSDSQTVNDPVLVEDNWRSLFNLVSLENHHSGYRI